MKSKKRNPKKLRLLFLILILIGTILFFFPQKESELNVNSEFLQNQTWFETKFGSDSTVALPKLHNKDFSKEDYLRLISMVQDSEDPLDLRVPKVLVQTLYAYFNENPNSTKNSDLKKIIYSEEFILKEPSLLSGAKNLRNDEVFVSKLIDKDPSVFKYVSDELKDNDRIVKQVLTSKIKTYEPKFMRYGYVSERLRNSKEIALLAMKLDGESLKYAPMNFRDDLEVATAAVLKSGGAIQFASERLRRQKSFTLIATSKHAGALKYVVGKFKDDADVVKAACFHHSWALELASERLKDNEKFILELQTKDALDKRFVSERLKKKLNLS